MLVLDPPTITQGSGAPGVAIPGSGLAIPTSFLTTKYEARGLMLNNRDNLETYWITRFTGLSDAEVRDNREVNPDRHGEQFLGSLYGGKPLTLEGYIRAQSLEKLLDMQMALEEAFDDISEEFPLIGRTGSFERDWVVYVAKTGALEIPDEQTSMEWKRRFMVPLRTSKPATFSFKHYSASALLSTDDSLTVVNTGNREGVFRLVITGQLQDLEIFNEYTHQTFRLKPGVLVPAGRTWTIDFEEGTIFDDLGISKFDAYDNTSDWLYMAKNATQKLIVSSSNRNASAAVGAYWQMTYK